jgi:starch-binding outer membrane protein, SusD/RagB family
MRSRNNIFNFFILTCTIIGCTKNIQIAPNIGTLTTPQVFAAPDQANSAMSAIYFQMVNTGLSFSSCSMTINGGLCADEFISFDQTSTSPYVPFQTNTLISSNTSVYNYFWGDAYSTIYLTNALINGLQNSSSLTDSVKQQLTAQAEFIRAFCEFYLTNLFGDIPLPTSINWRTTGVLNRTPQTQVYQAIISDLKNAQSVLPGDYSAGNNQRIVPNKWAATALLARVYLYIKDWKNAQIQSSLVISNAGLYSLPLDLTQVFLTNSPEAIWQLQQDNKGFSYNAVPEADRIIPYDNFSPPLIYLTTQLLNTFEMGDNRKTSWIDSTSFSGSTYYYPFKYKLGIAEEQFDGPMTEYYMVLRLAEQYLIRAESNAQLGNDPGLVQTDLNTIRQRAGLSPITANGQDTLLADIAHERRVELFAEWGHRWLDLKRTGMANSVLSAMKPKWTPAAQLFPIPAGELQTDPNLTQNPGY